MSRHARYYKEHFACFQCRKAFKKHWWRHHGFQGRPGGKSDQPYPCPDCGEPMNTMGIDFKAPPRRALDQWLKVEILYTFGLLFDPGPSNDDCLPGDRPAQLNEVEDFLVGRGFPKDEVRQRIDVLVRSAKR